MENEMYEVGYEARMDNNQCEPIDNVWWQKGWDDADEVLMAREAGYGDAYHGYKPDAEFSKSKTVQEYYMDGYRKGEREREAELGI